LPPWLVISWENQQELSRHILFARIRGQRADQVHFARMRPEPIAGFGRRCIRPAFAGKLTLSKESWAQPYPARGFHFDRR
jgi:hypothetical protein